MERLEQKSDEVSGSAENISFSRGQEMDSENEYARSEKLQIWLGRENENKEYSRSLLAIA